MRVDCTLRSEIRCSGQDVGRAVMESPKAFRSMSRNMYVVDMAINLDLGASLRERTGEADPKAW